MQVREVLEVYRAHPPLGRFSFRRLVGMYGSGPCPREPSDTAKNPAAEIP